MQRPPELVLKPRRGWSSFDFGELWHHRELLYFLTTRDIKIRYRQTGLGITWAMLQPLLGMIIFTFLFNRLAGIQSGSDVPYPLFAYAGLLAWNFFFNAVTLSSNSLIGNRNLISKIYFPRPYIPLGSIGALLLDLVLGLVLLFVLMAWFGWGIAPEIVLLPVFVLGTFFAAAGCGLFLSAISVRFRDVKYAVPFLVQFGLFITPVIYPAKMLDKYPVVSDFIGLNPMAGMVHGFRYTLLGAPADWQLIGVSYAVSLALFFGGLFFFRRWERQFADII